MDKLTRIGMALLGIAVVGLLIVVAKDRLGIGDAPPAAIEESSGDSPAKGHLDARTVRPPTILQASPSRRDGPAAPPSTTHPYEEFRGTPALDAEPELKFPPQLLPVESVPASDEAAEASEPAAQPPLGESTRVITQPQDSLWEVSKRVYGTGAYYRALYQHNRARIAQPDALAAGIELETPPIETLARRYPDVVPRAPTK